MAKSPKEQYEVAKALKGLDVGILGALGIDPRRITEITQFAQSYFPQGCNLYVDGRLSEGGLAVANFAMTDQRAHGKAPDPCASCKHDGCDVRQKPYEPKP